MSKSISCLNQAWFDVYCNSRQPAVNYMIRVSYFTIFCSLCSKGKMASAFILVSEHDSSLRFWAMFRDHERGAYNLLTDCKALLVKKYSLSVFCVHNHAIILEFKDRDGTIKGGLTTKVSFFGRTHGAPYRGYGYVPLRFGGGGTSLGEWEHNNNKVSFCLLSSKCQHLQSANKIIIYGISCLLVG